MREGAPSLAQALDAFLDDVGISRARLTRVTYEVRLRPLRLASTWAAFEQAPKPLGRASLGEGRSDSLLTPLTCSIDDLPSLAEGVPPSHQPEYPLAYLNSSTCRQLIASQSHLAPATIQTFAGALSSFCAFCLTMGWLSENPMRGVRVPRPPLKPHRTATGANLAALARVAEEHDMLCHSGTVGPSWRLILCLLSVGLRAAEVCSARVEDIEWDEEGRPSERPSYPGHSEQLLDDAGVGMHTSSKAPVAYVRPPSHSALLLVKGKGSRYRWVPLPPDTPLPASGRLVPTTTRTLGYHVKRMGKLAGIPNLHPHLLRHTFATRALEDGYDIPTVQAVMGHADARMTAFYARSIYQKQAARSMRRFV